MEQKITPNDLRLGNCLYYTKESKFPMQVEGIGKDWIYLNFEGNDGDVFENNGDEIYPIPLSMELIHNLSSPDDVIENEYDIHIGGNCGEEYSVEFAIDKIGKGIYLVPTISDNEYDIGKHIKYVHELQNLYHVLTGKELEIRREWL